MRDGIGNYAKHARYWDWGKLDRDRTPDDEYWYHYAKRYGNSVLIPMCALGEAGAYMARRGMNVTAFDITPEMIAEGKKRFGDVAGLKLIEGDVTGFRFDIAPVDFCYCVDFGHIHEFEDIKKALACINSHLRGGGGLVIEAGLPEKESNYFPPKTFYPATQAYPGLTVWKTGDTRIDAETGRCHISQTFYARNESGNVECFDHSFYLQSYSRDVWLAGLGDCGFDAVGEYRSRDKSAWTPGDGLWIVEAVKRDRGREPYGPSVFGFLPADDLAEEEVTLKCMEKRPAPGGRQGAVIPVRRSGGWAARGRRAFEDRVHARILLRRADRILDRRTLSGPRVCRKSLHGPAAVDPGARF